jgi:hypothetical protein
MNIKKNLRWTVIILLITVGCPDSRKPSPSISVMLPNIKFASLCIIHHEKNKPSTSEVLISRDSNELPTLLKQCIPLSSKPTSIPKSVTFDIQSIKWKINIVYDGMIETVDYPVNLSYYPEQHLLWDTSKRDDAWAKTTPALDAYLQKVISDYEKNKK